MRIFCLRPGSGLQQSATGNIQKSHMPAGTGRKKSAFGKNPSRVFFPGKF